MGRRPNPIISEFFQRGPKLEDASNRYQHTCRRCGELFPKGRMDSLLAHLLKRCPNANQNDRNTVFLYLQHNPEHKRASTTTSHRVAGQGFEKVDVKVAHQQQQQQQQQQEQEQNIHQQRQLEDSQEMALPFLLQREQSALHTLAEVSRRHLESSAQQQGSLAGSDLQMLVRESEQAALAEQALWAQLQQHTFVQTPSSGDAHGMNTYNPYDAQASTSLYSNNTIPPGGSAASPLVQTASAANQQLEQAQDGQSQHESLDPQLGGDTTNAHFDVQPHGLPSQCFEPDKGVDTMHWSPTEATGTRAQQPSTNAVTSNEPAPGFNLLQKSFGTKLRGRFSDSRRKEVQEIRKRGACIRCRMLKKPCSEGTPCNTCKSVETARLWKGQCLRTRIADELSLFSTMLFHTRARAKVPTAVLGLNNERVGGRIEAKFYPDISLCLTFAAKRYSNSVSTAISQDEAPQRQNCASSSTVPSILLVDDGEGTSDKVSEYCTSEAVLDAAISNEPDHFLQVTLQQAKNILHTECGIEGPAGQGKDGQPRLCYSLPDHLLRNVLELWIETSILTLSSPPNRTAGGVPFAETGLGIRYDSAELPELDPLIIPWSELADTASSIQTLQPGEQSFELIKAQLLAATEIRVAKLSKVVMNELERRILQRQQVSGFATFIAAVLLLNCVERMTGFFNLLDFRSISGNSVSSTMPSDGFHPIDTPSSMSTTAIDHAQDSLPAEYPPSSTLSKMASQGRPFAALLATLLRMRALPPKTTTSADGKIAVLQDGGLSVKFHGTPVRVDGTDEQTHLAKMWIDDCSADWLEMAQKMDEEAGQDVRDWDRRFIAMLLLSEQQNGS